MAAASCWGDLYIDPSVVGGFAEQVALNLSPGRDISVFADQQRDRIVAAHRAVGDHAANLIGARVIRVPHLLEHPDLHFVLVGRSVSLGEIERDVAGGERLEDGLGQVGEAQPTFDETLRQPEPLRNGSGIAVFLDEVLECLTLLGRGHLKALEIFGQRNLAGVMFAPVDDETRNLVIGFHGAPGHDNVHRAHSLAAADDFEAATLLRLGNDEVLQDAASFDVIRQALLEFEVRPLADIVLALVELAQRDELHSRYS